MLFVWYFRNILLVHHNISLFSAVALNYPIHPMQYYGSAKSLLPGAWWWIRLLHQLSQLHCDQLQPHTPPLSVLTVVGHI